MARVGRIPLEIENLIWAIAENPTPNAVLEFEMRYPDYRLEMLKRVEMVRGLRVEAKGPSFNRQEIPRFEPRVPASGGLGGAVPTGLPIALGLAFAAAVLVTFTIFHAPTPVAPKMPSTGAVLSEPASPPMVVYGDSNNLPHIVHPRESVVPQTTQSSPVLPLQPEARSRVATNDGSRDLDLRGVNMVDALDLITSGTNLKLDLGPGFVNQKVTLAFKNKSTNDMLSEMAKDYAFTLIPEGPNRFLLQPIQDDNSTVEANVDEEEKAGP
jgi:hypothetical protein